MDPAVDQRAILRGFKPILRVPLATRNSETRHQAIRRLQHDERAYKLLSVPDDPFAFPKNPGEWFLYHTLYREARSTWPEVPFKVFAEWLKRRKDWVVGDFGCGEAQLARLVSNKVYSFDHVAVNNL